jgi:hypothetical protein
MKEQTPSPKDLDGPLAKSGTPQHETEEYHSYYKEIMSKSKYSEGGSLAIRKAKKVILDCDPGGDDA